MRTELQAPQPTDWADSNGYCDQYGYWRNPDGSLYYYATYAHDGFDANTAYLWDVETKKWWFWVPDAIDTRTGQQVSMWLQAPTAEDRIRDQQYQQSLLDKQRAATKTTMVLGGILFVVVTACAIFAAVTGNTGPIAAVAGALVVFLLLFVAASYPKATIGVGLTALYLIHGPLRRNAQNTISSPYFTPRS